jgi:tRNA (cmo5U34)-methyltransferase
MSSPLNRFNWISGVYDSLTGLIFGKSFAEAQTFFLSEIPPRSKVLILGGGTGWILKALLNINSTCEVYYIEASSKMLEKSKKRIEERDQNRVRFILGTESNIDSTIKFDAVITNFFLDLFSDSLQQVIQKIKISLGREAVWIVTDFVDRGKFWHRLMLSVMYRFFRVTTGIEATRLPDYEKQLLGSAIKKSKEKFFFGSFINSAVYSINE